MAWMVRPTGAAMQRKRALAAAGELEGDELREEGDVGGVHAVRLIIRRDGALEPAQGLREPGRRQTIGEVGLGQIEDGERRGLRGRSRAVVAAAASGREDAAHLLVQRILPPRLRRRRAAATGAHDAGEDGEHPAHVVILQL